MSENPSLSVLILNADNGVGLALTRSLSKHGARVMASTARGAEGATAIRAAGGVPIYPELGRSENLRAMMQAGKASVVVNLAALPLALSPHSAPDYAAHLGLLTEVTPALVQACAAAGVERLISLSFAFVYGDAEGAMVDENSPTHADNALFKAALNAEKAVLEAGGAVLRLGYVYGDDAATHALLDQVVKGRAALGGAGKASFIHEDDVASAIQALILAEREREGRIFNLSDDYPLTHDEFLAILGQQLGVGAPPKRGFQFVPDELREQLLAQSFALSSSRARVELGWKPTYGHVNQGIDRVLMLLRAAAAPATPVKQEKDLTLA